MLKLYEQYKDTNYKIAVEKYLKDFAVDKTVQELTVYNRLKANYKQACSLRAKNVNSIWRKILATQNLVLILFLAKLKILHENKRSGRNLIQLVNRTQNLNEDWVTVMKN